MDNIIVITKDIENTGLYVDAIEYTIDVYRRSIPRNPYKIKARLGSRMLVGELGECKYRELVSGMLSITLKCAWKSNFIDNLSVLIHESIHAAQHITGMNIITPDGEFFWSGKSYGHINYDILDSDGQYILPWEEEAYDLENDMISDFIQYYTSEVRSR